MEEKASFYRELVKRQQGWYTEEKRGDGDEHYDS